MGVTPVLQVGSTFVCNSLADPLRGLLAAGGEVASVRLTEPAELSQYMLAPDADSEDIAGTLVLVRVEDLVRDSGEVTDDRAARPKLKARLEEFLGQISVLAMR